MTCLLAIRQYMYEHGSATERELIKHCIATATDDPVTCFAAAMTTLFELDEINYDNEFEIYDLN